MKPTCTFIESNYLPNVWHLNTNECVVNWHKKSTTQLSSKPKEKIFQKKKIHTPVFCLVLMMICFVLLCCRKECVVSVCVCDSKTFFKCNFIHFVTLKSGNEWNKIIITDENFSRVEIVTSLNVIVTHKSKARERDAVKLYKDNNKINDVLLMRCVWSLLYVL